MARRSASKQQSSDDLEKELLEFAEQFALVYELDLPRIAGKILGYLFVCDPPVRTQSELAEALSASRGSVSTMTRLLEQFGWVERVSKPGHRQVGYRVRDDAWVTHVEVHLQRANALHKLALQGQELLEGQPPARTARIDTSVEFLEYWRDAMPELIERWKSSRQERAAS